MQEIAKAVARAIYYIMLCNLLGCMGKGKLDVLCLMFVNCDERDFLFFPTDLSCYLLQKIGQPISDRYTMHTEIPGAYESFGKLLTRYRKILDLYEKKVCPYFLWVK